jgi:hypothetical protein
MTERTLPEKSEAPNENRFEKILEIVGERVKEKRL